MLYLQNIFSYLFLTFLPVAAFCLNVCYYIYEFWSCQVNTKYKVGNWSPVRLQSESEWFDFFIWAESLSDLDKLTGESSASKHWAHTHVILLGHIAQEIQNKTAVKQIFIERLRGYGLLTCILSPSSGIQRLYWWVSISFTLTWAIVLV